MRRCLLTVGLIAAVLLSTLSVSAGVIFETPAEIIYEQLFDNTATGGNTLPDGWTSVSGSRTIVYNKDNIRLDNTVNPWQLYGDETVTVPVDMGYRIVIEASKFDYTNVAQRQFFYAMTDDDISALKYTSATGTESIAANGYTIVFQWAEVKTSQTAKPNIQIWKDREMKGVFYIPVEYFQNPDGQMDCTAATRNTDRRFRYELDITGDITTLRVYHVTNDGESLIATEAGEAVLSFEDANPDRSGKFGYYHYGTTNARIYGFSCTTLPQSKTYDNYLLHKTFGDVDDGNIDDTISGLKADGWLVGEHTVVNPNYGVQLNYTGSPDFSAPAYGSSAENFVYGLSFDGDYTARIAWRVAQMYGRLMVNYQDDQNYYGIDVGRFGTSADGYSASSQIVKVVNGVETVVASADVQSLLGYEGYRTEASTDSNVYALLINSSYPNTIQVEHVSDGDKVTGVKLTVTLVDKNGNLFDQYTWTDEIDPIVGGTVGVRHKSCGNNRLLSISICPKTLDGVYTVDGLPAASYAAGEIGLQLLTLGGEMPAMIAALYQDDTLIRVKILQNTDFAEQTFALMDTGDLAGNGYQLKTFIWDQDDGITPITAPICLQ